MKLLIFIVSLVIWWIPEPAIAIDYIDCRLLLKSKKDIDDIATTARCAKGMKKIGANTAIGEYSVWNGGDFGSGLDIRSFAMLGTGIKAGRDVFIGGGTCIANNVKLQNDAEVRYDTAINVEKGKQVTLAPKAGIRYVLKNGQCKSENA